MVVAVASSWELLGRAFESPESLRRHVLAFGAFAPVVSVFLSAAQVIVAPIPGQFVGVANGFLYGVTFGTVLSMLGLGLGSAVAMWIGRRLGRVVVARFVSETTLCRLDAIPQRRAELIFFLIFLLPALPDDVACFAIGLSCTLSIPRMVVISMLGRFPGMVAACFLGAHATDVPTGTMVAVVVGIVASALLLARYGDAIEARLVAWLARVRG